MSARLFSAQDIPAEPVVNLLGTGERRFVLVELTKDGRTYIDVATSSEAYALRDALQRAGDLLAGTEAGGPA